MPNSSLPRPNFENLFNQSGYNRILAGMDSYEETKAMETANLVAEKLEKTRCYFRWLFATQR